MTLAVNIAQGGANNVTMRNRIINGAMMIDQRNAGASLSMGASTYPVDRFRGYASQTSKMTMQQNAGSVTPPVNFKNYLGFTSSSAYSSLATDRFFVYQAIEGYNVSDLNWGTANASSITLSFWARSSLTGTFSGALNNNASNRCYAFTYTISSANTWEYKTVTIAGDQSGTWLTDNNTGIEVHFNLGSGSNYLISSGSWQATYANGATGSTSVVGTNGATFYITGVQLEAGTTATAFEQRLYGTELSLCQRYYNQFGTNANYEHFGIGLCQTSQSTVLINFPVAMRANPSFSYAGSLVNFQIWDGSAFGTISALAFDTSAPTIATVTVTCSGLTIGRATRFYRSATNQATIMWSAEL